MKDNHSETNKMFLIGRLLLCVSLAPGVALFMFTLFELHLGFSDEIQKNIYQVIALCFITTLVGAALMIVNMIPSNMEKKTAV